jgi:transmembrane sensor
MADPAPTGIEREAARWLVLLDEPNLDRARISRFRDWLAADARHKQAYEALSATSDRIDAFLGRQQASDAAARLHALPRRDMVGRRWMMAGALAAACVAFFAQLRGFDPFTTANAQSYATPAGLERALQLTDGSELVMAPGARLRVALSSEVRRVRLDRGVTLFNVAEDGGRDFVVSTPFGDIRATDASFVVRLDDDHAVATILNGRAAAHAHFVWPRTDVAPDAFGQRNAEFVLAAGGVTASALSPGAVGQRLLWRQRMVSLAGQSLREAAMDIEGFSGAQFVFADAQTASIRLNGYISGDDVEGFLHLLEANIGVHAARRRDGAIVLSRASPT